MASDSIVIRGAREHNLADVDVSIPRDKLVVRAVFDDVPVLQIQNAVAVFDR